MAFRTTVGCSATTELHETRGELDNILGSYVTKALHTARISNVERVFCGRNKRKIMINYKIDLPKKWC